MRKFQFFPTLTTGARHHHHPHFIALHHDQPDHQVRVRLCPGMEEEVEGEEVQEGLVPASCLLLTRDHDTGRRQDHHHPHQLVVNPPNNHILNMGLNMHSFHSLQINLTCRNILTMNWVIHLCISGIFRVITYCITPIYHSHIILASLYRYNINANAW